LSDLADVPVPPRAGQVLPPETRMHAPIKTVKSAEVRARIQVAKILYVLDEHVHGKRHMTTTQIAAAKILLDKALPDLHTTTLQSEGGNPITISISADDAKVL
jgi:hypothetical protein